MNYTGEERRAQLSFLRRFTPANWIQIALLLFAIIAGYFNFEYRIRRLEEWRIEVSDMRERDNAILTERLSTLQSREIIALHITEINRRLGRIEKRLRID